MLRHILILSIALTYSFGNHIKPVKDHKVKDGKSNVFGGKKPGPANDPPKIMYDAVKNELIDVSDTNTNDPPFPPNPFRPHIEGQSFVVGPPQFRDADGIKQIGNSAAQANDLKSSDAKKPGPEFRSVADGIKQIGISAAQANELKSSDAEKPGPELCLLHIKLCRRQIGNSAAQANELKSSDAKNPGPEFRPVADPLVNDAVKNKLIDVSDTNTNDPPFPPNPFRPHFQDMEKNDNSAAQANQLKSSDAKKSGPDELPVADGVKDVLEKTLSRMQNTLRMLKDALNNSKIKITAKRSSGRSNTKKDLKKTLSKLEKDFRSLKSLFQNE